MKPFFDTVACKSGAHCRMCRDKETGRAWRGKVLPSAEPDFPCPKRRQWGFSGDRFVPSIVRGPSAYDLARSAIVHMENDERGMFLKSMLAQIEELIRERRCGSCRERKAYAKRMREKVVYLHNQYGPN